MRHLGERITDFVFGEMPAEEMAEAKRHLTDCKECRLEVQQFEQTHAFLKTSADVEPPRQIVFEVEKPRFAWKWSSFMPAALAAAILLAVFIAAPIHTEWHDSQLTVVFGKTLQPVDQKMDQKVEGQIQQLQAELDYWKDIVKQTQMENVAMAGDIQTVAKQRNGGSKDSGGGSN